MKVKGITADWCGKCDVAKVKLADYPIEWVDVDDVPEYEGFKINELPTFIIINENDVLESIVTKSVLFVKRMFEDEHG